MLVGNFSRGYYENYPGTDDPLAVLAVVGTLGGVWLGHYFERDNEVFKWRRDHALEAYSEVIKAVEAVRNAADISYFSYFNGPCVTEQHAKHMGIVADKLAELLEDSSKPQN